MDKKEYLINARNCELNKTRIDKIEKIYSHELNKGLAAIISFAGKVDFFDEERRALDFEEICNPLKALGYDFLKEGLIPIIDAYDNTYIVFSFKEDVWAKFSIIDSTLFKKKKSLEEVL